MKARLSEDRIDKRCHVGAAVLMLVEAAVRTDAVAEWNVNVEVLQTEWSVDGE
jgi:hypothetical protein